MLAATKMMLTRAAPAAVAFDAAAGTAQANAISWNHTIGAADIIMIGLLVSNSTLSGVTVGGAAATQIGTPLNIGGTVWIHIYYKLNPTTGVQTVTASGAGFYNNGGSVTYKNVSSVGSAQTNTGSGTTPAQSVSSAAGQMVFQVFGSAGSAAMSAYNQTQRYNNFTNFVGYPIVVGDAPGSGTVNFSATAPSAAWGAVAVPLSP